MRASRALTAVLPGWYASVDSCGGASTCYVGTRKWVLVTIVPSRISFGGRAAIWVRLATSGSTTCGRGCGRWNIISQTLTIAETVGTCEA